MSQRLVTLIAFALTLSAASSTCIATPTSTPTIRSVIVRGTAICISLQQKLATPMRCFADNGLAKTFPLWSRDGTQIAFIEQTKKSLALNKLVIINQHGQPISSVLIKANVPGEIQSGMRFVESLEWLGRDKIAVSGSVNPGTTEYNIVDIGQRKVVKEFFDDGRVTSFSPNGQHYTSISDSPHFTPAQQRTPMLNIDGVPVLAEADQSLTFADKAQWSPDSKSVALHAVNTGKGTHHLVRWNLGTSRVQVSLLPNAASAPDAMFWANGTLHLQQKVDNPTPLASEIAPGKRNFITLAWNHSPSRSVNQTDRSMQWIPTTPLASTNPQAKAKALRTELGKQLQILQGEQADFWCADCDLSLLPRQNGMAD